MTEEFSYTGTKFLEVIREAHNYNQFLEDELVAFIKPEAQAIAKEPVIDFGAGIGEFARRVAGHGIAVNCVELDAELQAKLRQDGFSVYAAIEGYPASPRIYTLNVLEHIEDDVAALKSIHAKLTEGGKLFIYVPAFMCLYSEFDKQIGHFRRYTRPEIKQKLEAAVFTINRLEYVDCIGFICWFFLYKLCINQVDGSGKMVKFFDSFLFPPSRFFDRIFSKFFGKNLLVIASKKTP